MYLLHITKASLLAFVFLLPPWAALGNAQSKEEKPKADNTAVNARDRSPGADTADQQKENATDRKLSAKIRRSIMADKSLSTYAKNVKVISQGGTVTLKGPVRSDEEVKSIVAKAKGITGHADKVVNELSVSPESKP